MAPEIDLAGLTESLAEHVAAVVQRHLAGPSETVPAQVELREADGARRPPAGGTDQAQSDALVQAFRDLGLSEGHAQIAARGRPLAETDPLADVFVDLGLSADAAKIASRGWDR